MLIFGPILLRPLTSAIIYIYMHGGCFRLTSCTWIKDK